MSKTLEKDNLPRDLTVEKLEEVLGSVPGLPAKVEQVIFEKYEDPQDYLLRLATLLVFLDPTKGQIGSLAKLFRDKAAQGVYTAERLADLDITEMLPELFLSEKADIQTKLRIYNDLQPVLRQRRDELFDAYFKHLNPQARIRARQAQRVFPPDKLIKANAEDVADLCYNPSWEMKRSNIIVCKQDGKFYCLDLEDLIYDLATLGEAFNQYTKKRLPEELVNNLRKRYAKEIEENKDREFPLPVGEYTETDREDLRRSVKKLTDFKDVFNKDRVQASIEIFGLAAMEDVQEGGVKGILANIPEEIYINFEKISDRGDIAELKKHINYWLDTNINKIKTILVGPEDKGKEKLFIEEQILGEKGPISEIYEKQTKRISSVIEAAQKNIKKAESEKTRKILEGTIKKAEEDLEALKTNFGTFKDIDELLKGQIEYIDERIEEAEDEEEREALNEERDRFLEAVVELEDAKVDFKNIV